MVLGLTPISGINAQTRKSGTESTQALQDLQKKIDFVIEQQKNGNSYGGLLRKRGDNVEYTDGFEFAGHAFVTYIIRPVNMFSTYGDNILTIDFLSDGLVDIVASNDEQFKPLKDGKFLFYESTKNQRVLRLEFYESDSPERTHANAFQDSIVGIAIEKYQTKTVSPEALIRYKKAKENLLQFLK